MIVETCPRCGSIDRRGHRIDRFTEYECQMCGWCYYSPEAKLREFAGEKTKKKYPPEEDGWLFPELKPQA